MDTTSWHTHGTTFGGDKVPVQLPTDESDMQYTIADFFFFFHRRLGTTECHSSWTLISIDFLHPDGTLAPDLEVVGSSGLVYSLHLSPPAIPEPSTFVLGILGLLALGLFSGRRRRRA